MKGWGYFLRHFLPPNPEGSKIHYNKLPKWDQWSSFTLQLNYVVKYQTNEVIFLLLWDSNTCLYARKICQIQTKSTQNMHAVTYILNSGNSLYKLNSSIHSAEFLGSFSPNSFHVTMDRPDSVSLVTPPRITAPNTMPLQPSNQ